MYSLLLNSFTVWILLMHLMCNNVYGNKCLVKHWNCSMPVRVFISNMLQITQPLLLLSLCPFNVYCFTEF